MHFVDFRFLLSVLSKVERKISVSFKPIQNFKILDLAMVKVKKINITVTYILPVFTTIFIVLLWQFLPTFSVFPSVSSNPAVLF
jgi:hypothetical protein